MIDGIVLLDKPRGYTSHDLVDKLRKILRQERIGHTGILDPLATGLMIMLLGKGTLLSPQLTGADKIYRATFLFGRATDTYDGEGKIISEADPGNITYEEFSRICLGFKGKIKQMIPPYSAAKHDGQKMYESARRGEDIPEKFKEVELYSIDIDSFEWPRVGLTIRCSAGTYVRSLAHEMGMKLGCGAYLESLVRNAVGQFTIDQAVTAEQIENEDFAAVDRMIRPLTEALPGWPKIFVRAEYVRLIIQGRPFIKKYFYSTDYRGPGGCQAMLIDDRGKLLALVQLNYSWGSFDRLDSRDTLGKYIRIIDESHFREKLS